MKVISISDREGAAGPTSARRTQALQKIRDTAGALLGQAFREMLDRADDLLFAFAEKAENNTQQSLYFDAMRELRAKRTPMHQSFMEALGGGFDRRCQRGRTRRGDAGGTSPSTLSLLDDATMEQDITIAGLAERIATAAREELFGLNKRLAQLLEVEELSAEDNPVGPTTIVEAARCAADALAVDFKVRLIVLKLFDRHVGAQVAEVYAQLNQQLIEQGILPTIAMQVRRQPARTQGPAAASITAAAPADMLTMLNQLMQPGAVAAGATPVPLIPINVSAMQSLTQLQRQPLSALIGEEQPGPRMLVDLQRGGVLPQMGPAGDMTIDIVAMLFEYILEDRNVPEEIRARLARLQIPILKVALIDREFFSRKAHPARRLLNLIAESATLASSDPITAQELVRIIDRLVHRITAEFDQDVGIFGRSVLALQSAMQKLKQEAVVRAKRSARVVDGRAQLERAKELARGLLDSRLRPEGVPESVRNFLLTHWQRLLITLACKDGEDSETLRSAIRTMDQLVWSTLPKSTVEERRKLTRMLPELLTQLRAGMEAISMPAVARNNFLARIEKVHGEAVRGIGSQPAEHPSGTPAAAPSLEPDSTTTPPVVEQAAAPKLGIDAFVATRQTPTSAEFPADFEMLDITTGEVSSDLNELLAKEAAAAVAEVATEPSNGIAEPQQPLASTQAATATSAPPQPARPSRSEIAMRMLAEAQTAAEQLRARLDTGDEVRLADVMPPVDQLPEPAPTSKVNALLDITANTFYRLFTPGTTGDGTTAGLQFEELTLGDTRDPATARLDGHYLEQVKALRPGNWLEMRREDGTTVQVRLGAFDEGSSRFRFVDRHGHAIAERTLRELVLDFSRGSARTIAEPPGMLDRAFTRLLDPSTWRGRNR